MQTRKIKQIKKELENAAAIRANELKKVVKDFQKVSIRLVVNKI